METLTFNSEKELKPFVDKNRRSIVSINNVEFSEYYPILSVSNKHASYYEAGANRYFDAPFTVISK